MALNLWTLGGQPANFNPIPANHPRIIIGLGEYYFSCMARSATGGKLNVVDDNSDNLLKNWTLTNEFKLYEASFTSTKQNQNLWVQDFPSRTGDIEIKDIQLVEKPLGAATINGIDGFASGKWSLHANAKVIDDETLELNATASFQSCTLKPVLDSGKTVTFSLGKDSTPGAYFQVNFLSKNGAVATPVVVYAGESKTLISPVGTEFVEVILSNNQGAKRYTFHRPMLNLGSTSAPYSKKTGTRMVKPEARKNLIQFQDLSNWSVDAKASKIIQTDGTLVIENTVAGNGIWTTSQNLGFKQNQDFVFSFEVRADIPQRVTLQHWLNNYFDADANWKRVSAHFKAGTTNYGIAIKAGDYFTTGKIRVRNIQIEEGTTATPYEPYAVQQNAKPRKSVQVAPKGLSFDGVRDYLKLPSMTMDRVELDCVLNHTGLAAGYILDARTGSPTGYAYTGGFGADILRFYVDGVLGASRVFSIIPSSKRIKLDMDLNAFTGQLTLFARYTGFEPIKGMLYGVKCYLKGELVASYDFTQPGTVVGDKVLLTPQNLIPSFDDKGWSLHSNFRILGRDVGRLDATAAYQICTVAIPVKSGKKYLIISEPLQAGALIAYYKSVNGVITYISETNDLAKLREFTADFTGDLLIRLMNSAAKPSGTFDFIKPQLYELPTTAGTLYGSPRTNLKPARRTLYNKR